MTAAQGLHKVVQFLFTVAGARVQRRLLLAIEVPEHIVVGRVSPEADAFQGGLKVSLSCKFPSGQALRLFDIGVQFVAQSDGVWCQQIVRLVGEAIVEKREVFVELL